MKGYWIFLLFSLTAIAQEAGELMHDGLLRDYLIYIPASYSPEVATPVVLNLHGYGSNATQQMIYSGFNAVADVNGFIVVCPNGTLDTVESPYWNAQWDEDGVDDVGFLSALIDHLACLYNVDLNKVYSTGMSNGGFMSYTLACSLGDRIAAIASVTGTMTLGQLDTCDPQRAIPVMEIHGTVDPTVPYEGTLNFMAGTDEVISYWVEHNSCNTEAVFELLPDLDETDGSTVEHYVYDCPLAPVELYKVIGGAHTWPGATFVFDGTNLDFVASEKIWEFFDQHSLPEPAPSGVEDEGSILANVKTYPNPTSDLLVVEFLEEQTLVLNVFDAMGKQVYRNENLTGNFVEINTSRWETGLYYLQVENLDVPEASSGFTRVVKVQ